MEEDIKSNADEEEIVIDLSKVARFFKKEKKKVEEEEKEIEEKIEKEDKKIGELEEKKEQLEEKEGEIGEKIGEEKKKLGELKEREAELKKEEKEIGKEEEKVEEKEEEIVFDIKQIKNLFRKKEKIEKTGEAKGKEEISFDTQKAGQFIVKHKTLFILLIPILLSIWFRAYPIYLPITDDWARDTVYNSIKGDIATQISQQYPNLPDKQKNDLVQKKFDEVLEQQKGAIEQQIIATSKYFTSRMQDEDGQTYLLAIDPWLWYGYASNYVRNGHFGNALVDGESWYTLRNGREGQRAGFPFFSLLTVINYKIMNIFTDASVMAAAFYMPLILITLASVAAFFIGKKFGGYSAALTASAIVGIHAALLNRTAAGFSDTDNIITFFELIVVMFFALAFEEKDKTKQFMLSGLAGLSMGIYFIAHASWWHIFDFILGAWGIYFLYYAWTKRNEIKKGFAGFVKLERTRRLLELAVGFVISSWVFGASASFIVKGGFIGPLKNIILTPIKGPLSFIALKQVAVTTVWPNVMTTVAELNRGTVSSVIAQIGGKLLFLLSIIGIIILILKKGKGERKPLFYGAFIALWYIGAVYAGQSSVRFIAFLVPAFALAMAAFVAFTYDYATKWFTKSIHINPALSKTIVIALLFLIIAMPLLRGADATAKHEVPSFNDAWYESLIGIKNDCEDGIITSWWDFGHWFVAVAERRVTFDGGDQGERIHWVGKSLLTSDEDMAIGILRMLNCGQEKPPHVLKKYLDNNTVKAIEVLNKIIVEDKKTAEQILKYEGLSEEAIEEVLNVTHCDDLLDQYYIASDDMVGKAGVWGHFGSWNFTKASMYNKVYNKPREKGIKTLTEEFGLDEEEANSIYYEIKANDADRWVSPWPGYMGISSCSVKNNVATCGNGLIVNLTNYDAKLILNEGAGVPYSIVYADKEDIHEKIFEGSTVGVSAALIPDGNGYISILMDPLHAKGMFTRLFFFEGHGLKCFDLLSYKRSFTGNEIYVYKVDWDCRTKNVMGEFKKEVEEGQEPEIQIEETEEMNENEEENTSANETIINKSGFVFDIS